MRTIIICLTIALQMQAGEATTYYLDRVNLGVVSLTLHQRGGPSTNMLLTHCVEGQAKLSDKLDDLTIAISMSELQGKAGKQIRRVIFSDTEGYLLIRKVNAHKAEITWRGKQTTCELKSQWKSNSTGYLTVNLDFILPLNEFCRGIPEAIWQQLSSDLVVHVSAGMSQQPILPLSEELKRFYQKAQADWSNMTDARLLVLLAQTDCLAQQVMRRGGVNLRLLSALPSTRPTRPGYTLPPISLQAIVLGQSRLSTLHLLLACMARSAELEQHFRKCELNRERLIRTVRVPMIPSHMIEVLGKPFGESRDCFSHNVWDLQHHGARVYLGYGMAGRARDIWCYDVKLSKFTRDATLPRQDLTRFFKWGSQLCTPSARLVSGKWRRSWPADTQMVVAQDKELFALTTDCLSSSKDDGRTWQRHAATAMPRLKTMFHLQGKLYAVGEGKVYMYQDEALVAHLVQLFPDHHRANSITKHCMFKGGIVYIGARATSSGHADRAFFAAAAITQARRVKLPEFEIPRDVMTVGDLCYLLTSRQDDLLNPTRGHRMTVWESMDLKQWRPRFRFLDGTYAQAFEFLDGSFYFALGSPSLCPSPLTGTILRIGTSKVALVRKANAQRPATRR